MRAVFGLVLLIGVGLAGFAVYMVQGYFEQQQVALERERARPQVPTVEVLAVNRMIGFGEALTAEDIVVVRYAEQFLPEGVFRTNEELFPEGTELPRTVLRQMEANEPVLAVKVTAPGEDAGITTRLKSGMRAFAISVNATSGVSGFLRPGDRVDVYWTGVSDFGNGAGNEVTKLIETGLRLVAVDQTSDQTLSEAIVARTVTVEATPQQVAKLAQAQTSGTLALSLVGLRDEIVASAVEVDQRSLLGIVEQEQVVEAAPVAPQVCTIRTRRGAEVVEIPIPCTN